VKETLIRRSAKASAGWRLGVLAFLCTLAGAGVAGADGEELKGDAARAVKVHDLILELSVAEADKELVGASPADQFLAIERALSLLYQGKCSEASTILAQPDLVDLEAVRKIGDISRGCEFATAGAVIREDEASGSWIRFQDDADVVLAPWFYEIVSATRAMFERDLGVTMPRPIRIELVRDQFALSAMTGLPLEAARTTGTIGIAKWGRVIVVSPRATDKGYPIMDTLAHELTHMALTRGSRDRAPLWLQEGVARIEESRWRDPTPFDDLPNADDMAAFGIRKNIGPDIDKIGPSIALLPSADEAQITYAKVQSFMRFYEREAGPRSMPKLLLAMRDLDDSGQLDPLITQLTGSSFADWSTRWKTHVASTAKELPDALKPGVAPAKELKEVRQKFRLGELLADRGHAEAAATELERAHTLMPKHASVRALYARALVDHGQAGRAKPLVERPDDVHHSEARWWSMRAALGLSLQGGADTNAAIRIAISLAPYDPAVACEEKVAPALPEDAARRALCEAARAKPRGR